MSKKTKKLIELYDSRTGQKTYVSYVGDIGGYVQTKTSVKWVPGPGRFVINYIGELRWISFNPEVQHLYGTY